MWFVETIVILVKVILKEILVALIFGVLNEFRRCKFFHLAGSKDGEAGSIKK